jgi:hypothetical protein
MRALALAVFGFATSAWSAPVVPPPPDMIPATGATVGRNTKIWVFEAGSGVQVFDSSGMTVEVTLTTITIPPFRGFEKLTPMTELQPGRYEVRAYGQVGSTFTVADQVDTTPPAPPQVEVSATGKVGNFDSAVTVTAAAASDTFIVVMGEPQSWEPGSAHAAGAKGSAVVYDLRAGEHRLKVVRVDAAGNASEPVEVSATVPKDRACSVAPVMPLSLLLLALLRRFSRAAA